MTTGPTAAPLNRGKTVGVVGAGAVGQAVTMAVVASGLCARLAVVSRTPGQADALAADLDDMRAALGSPTRPTAIDVTELRNCAAVVVALRTRFANKHDANIRMGGAQANAPAIAELGRHLRGYSGTVLVVTNPVDLMARLLADSSGCARVFGVGSGLDSARYRLTVARLLDTDPGSVRGQVIGEHGDAAVVCASTTTVDGLPLPTCLPDVRAELASRPGRISTGIGRTRAGPAGAVIAALRVVLGVADGVVELSAPYKGVWLGIPLRFADGEPTSRTPKLSFTEQCQFDAAHSKLRAAYDRLRNELRTSSALRGEL